MSIALYRRYRPENFQEVIGQSHVTTPLMAALASGRTTHAYLFSGPRGCGKTTSARILARCLNCVEYPTDTPCGKCDSCRELARNGSGSLDVVELDAASHGGVDDARELREQAGFAPVRDRFKIFIIDEAHMVSNQGFNALLKVVEEPPEHVKFIFATTEPEKVIGTIRSRTHHYPFRLVPPTELEDYLAQVCANEGIEAPRSVLSLAVRAGTGSVRDTMSVLDQLIGGSENGVLNYERAVALLGYTSAALLDEAVAAIAERDGAHLFSVVDSVVKSGHDPRRFVEDLLQRLRDLMIIALTGEAARDVFVAVPEDQYSRMVRQAMNLGASRASHCADLVNEALSQMVGATAPRLQLELLCARLIVNEGTNLRSSSPDAGGAGNSQVSANVGTTGRGPAVPPPAQLAKLKRSPQEAARTAAHPGQPTHSRGMNAPQNQRMPQTPASSAQVAPQDRPMPQMPGAETVERPHHVPVSPRQEQPSAEKPQEQAVHSAPREAASQKKPAVDPSRALNAVRGRWEDVLSTVKNTSKVAGSQLAASFGPIAFEDGALVIGFSQPGLAQAFGRHTGEVSAAIGKVFGKSLPVEARVGEQPSGGQRDSTRPPVPNSRENTDTDRPKVEAAQAAAPDRANNNAHERVSHGKATAEHTAHELPLATSAAEQGRAFPQPGPLGEPKDGLEETAHPEDDPVYHQDPSREPEARALADPAGVLGPLLSGEVEFAGEDHTRASAPMGKSSALPQTPAPTLDVPVRQDPIHEEGPVPGYEYIPPEFEPVPEEEFEPYNPAAMTHETPFYAQNMPAPPPQVFPTSQHQSTAAPVRTPAVPHEPSATDNFVADTARMLGRAPEHQSSHMKAATIDVAKLAAAHQKKAEEQDDWDEVTDDDPEISVAENAGVNILVEKLDAQIVEEIPLEEAH
ncbi:DNA polymerase III subunit gamma and tau [Arcanobacterium canis]|uniref:DNA-directed DNA polymerase n=1 Tax=Arcanobacterium canis TaxID=999183 RepID=A0ABY8FZ49_9ACTO|nr:DNA polymerase III subunit gamma and tau [Arcanobacterium canis]WFM83592.1 DNA polymerase III subunit gamma and tau [Arcanobacterium canis]